MNKVRKIRTVLYLPEQCGKTLLPGHYTIVMKDVLILPHMTKLGVDVMIVEGEIPERK